MGLNIELNNIQENIERTIFHSVRNLCVELGYTPDMNEFDKTPEGYNQYLQSLETIKNGEKGFSIEVFNAGPASDRQIKQVPRIVLENEGFNPGDIGGDFAPQYDDNGDGTFTKYHHFDQVSDFYFNLCIISGNITQDRILKSIIARAIPRRGYIKLYNGDSRFLVLFLSHSKIFEDRLPGVNETAYRYVCKDLVEVERTVIADNIPSLLDLNVDVQFQDGELVVLTRKVAQP